MGFLSVVIRSKVNIYVMFVVGYFDCVVTGLSPSGGMLMLQTVTFQLRWKT